MGLLWPHKVRIVAASSTGAFAEDDTWVPGAEEGAVLYDGLANVYDGGQVRLGRTLVVDPQGRGNIESAATCYLKKKNAAAGIPEGSVVKITWADKTISDAVVVGVVRAENSLDLRWV